MTITDDERYARRRSFGTVAEEYERWRPTYPDALWADLAAIGGFGPDAVGVEIGCGTGQATAPLSQIVGTLHVVDLSAELLAFTADKLADRTNLELHNQSFESFDPGDATCDLVCAASSFHWLDPDRSYAHAADLLHPGGWLAIIHPHGLAGGTPGFFEAIQPAHVAAFDSARDYQLPDKVDISDQVAAFADAGRFAPAEVRLYEQEVTHTAESVSGVMGTFSNVIALPEDTRERFLDEIATVVDRDFGGSVTSRVCVSLVMAARSD